MAGGTDGSLNFDTKIDESGFEKGAITLKKQMEGIVRSITKAGNSIASSMGQQTTSKVVDLTGKIQQTEAAIDQLKQKMATLAATDVNASMIQKLNQQIDKAEQNMSSLLNQREQLEMDYQLPGLTAEAQQRVYAQSTEWQRLSMQINQAEQVLTGYERKLAEVKMMSAGTDATQSQEYQSAQIKLQGLTNRLNVYKTKLQETKEAQNKTSGSSNGLSGSLNKVKKKLRQNFEVYEENPEEYQRAGKVSKIYITNARNDTHVPGIFSSDQWCQRGVREFGAIQRYV